MGTLLKRENTILKKTIFSAFILLISLSMIIPFYFMISISLKYNADISSQPLKFLIPGRVNWGNYTKLLFHYDNFRLWYANSLYVVFMVILLRGIFVTMAAYAFARLNFRGKNIIFIVLLSSMMVTSDTTIVARYILYKYLGLYDTHLALIIPAIADVFFLFLLRQFFMGIPKELSEAAHMDGCSHFKIYYRIILPLAKPVLMTMVLFTFIFVWNDFIGPFLFISSMKKQLLTAGLQFFQGEFSADTSIQMAGACLGILPPIILFSIFQNFFTQSLASTGIKG
ncbi:MAG: sugar transporter permease [Bacilli bacterium]|nr:sugar transporter permease [Bacilli bacterium]